MAWVNLTGAVQGPIPAPRFGNGMETGPDGRLYMFGGSGNNEANPSAYPPLGFLIFSHHFSK